LSKPFQRPLEKRRRGIRQISLITELRSRRDELPALGCKGELNPAKQLDPYAPDLVVEGHLADLRCQRTPFFKVQELYGIDPQFAVTFNQVGPTCASSESG
jgi:hypothetical protein